MCVREREREQNYVWVCEGQTDGQRAILCVCVCEREREQNYVCVGGWVGVSDRQTESKITCVCV